ncbi:hypothetical protein BPOR_1699g00020 [Botrytis porri]|uniref:Uncharacterized protein n=1 Tax=Botrytis porri TaxID=87229 RepID=A0A4Z1K9L4_9HELO|nr:hypothetical protein BPOR_1699g00020 [Botrytis porri]
MVGVLLDLFGEAICWAICWEIVEVIGVVEVLGVAEVVEVAETTEVVKGVEVNAVDDGVGEDSDEVLEETGDTK